MVIFSLGCLDCNGSFQEIETAPNSTKPAKQGYCDHPEVQPKLFQQWKIFLSNSQPA